MGASSSRNGGASIERKKSQAFERMLFRNHHNKKLGSFISMQSKEVSGSSEFDNARKLAFSDTDTHKGLRNLTGENNCFLNATIQALWHLGPFRYQMQKLMSMNKVTTETSNEEGCTKKKLGLFDALCNLFIQYQYTELKILPPTELRTTMSELFDQFQLGKIADANETLEAILETIHAECLPKCSYGKHNCLAHTVFGGLLMEQSTCTRCSSRSAPMLRSDFVHYVYAAELIALGEMNTESGKHKSATKSNSKQPPKRFGHLLHECMGVSPRCCPSLDDRTSSTGKDVGTEVGSSPSQRSSKKCDGKATVKLYALEPPMALAISVGWTQARESPKTLHSLLSLLSYTIELSDLFDLSKQSEHYDEMQSSLAACSKSNEDLDRTNGRGVLDPCQDGVNVTTDHITKSLNGRMDQSSSENKNSADSPPTSLHIDEKQTFSKNPSYVFRGFVCYYGLHYISILQESNHGEARFLLFDDQKVRPLGGWEDVKKECLKSLYQPVLLLYELQDSSPSPVCRSNPQPSVPSRHRTHGVQETKESGSRNVCCSSSSSSSSSTTRNRVSDVDTAPSISALHVAAKRHHAPDVTTSSSRLASSSGKHHVPPLMVIKSFEKRHITSYVPLEYERSHKKKLLGFQHDMDASGRLVIIGFHPHPQTGNMLPAEASGQICLWDQLLAIDNISVINYSLQQTTQIFREFRSEPSKKNVLLTLRSALYTEIWYRCPYCDMEDRLSKSEELRLREIAEHVLPKDFDEGRMSGDSLLEGEKSILTQCRTCLLRGSTRELLVSDTFS